MPTDSNERTAAMAWEDQLNYLIHPKWCNDPPDSGGSATDGHIVWESELVDIFPQTAGATSRELSKNIRGDLGALQASDARPPPAARSAPAAPHPLPHLTLSHPVPPPPLPLRRRS